MQRAGVLRALVATLVVLGPSTAHAAAGEPVRAYRVTQEIGLAPGQDGTFTLACRMGDVATDGTWRTDGLAVRVLEADSISRQTYRFAVSTDAVTPTRLRMVVVCLPGRVAGRRVGVLARRQASAAVVVAGPATAPAVRCPAGTVAIAPGFRLTGGVGRVSSLYPGARLRSSTLGLAAVEPLIVTSSARCLRRSSRLRVAFRVGATAVAAGRVESFTVSCRRRETPIVGGFRLSSAWYLGQTAGPRRRSFRVQASSSTTGGNARLGLVCLSRR